MNLRFRALWCGVFAVLFLIKTASATLDVYGGPTNTSGYHNSGYSKAAANSGVAVGYTQKTGGSLINDVAVRWNLHGTVVELGSLGTPTGQNDNEISDV